MIGYFVETASSYAGKIDMLFDVVFWLVGFWFFVAQFVLFYFIFKYRAKAGQKAQYVTGETKAEKRWISIPHIAIILFDVVIIAGAMYVWFHIKQDLPRADEKVRVIAQQWAWTFVHAGEDGELGTVDDITTTDHLHLQIGKTYHYFLESKDVLHSFSIPSFRLKQDAVPGREIMGWFKPIKTGDFDIQCAEICGIGHGIMSGQLTIHDEAGYKQWMASQRGKPASLAITN